MRIAWRFVLPAVQTAVFYAVLLAEPGLQTPGCGPTESECVEFPLYDLLSERATFMLFLNAPALLAEAPLLIVIKSVFPRSPQGLSLLLCGFGVAWLWFAVGCWLDGRPLHIPHWVAYLGLAAIPLALLFASGLLLGNSQHWSGILLLELWSLAISWISIRKIRSQAQ